MMTTTKTTKEATTMMRKTPLRGENRWVPPDGRGDNSDSIAIAENNAHWKQGDRVDDQIGLR
jgi:hypothetical protein